MNKFKEYLRRPKSLIVYILIMLSAALTVAVILFIIGYILIKGVPNITPELFSLKYNSKNLSMLPSIINTLYLTFLTLLIAVPVGVFSAIYLVEYAKKGSKFVKLIRVTNETLSGIPSIVYGFFYCALLGIFNDSRCYNACNNGFACYHQNNRRVTNGCR